MPFDFPSSDIEGLSMVDPWPHGIIPNAGTYYAPQAILEGAQDGGAANPPLSRSHAIERCVYRARENLRKETGE